MSKPQMEAVQSIQLEKLKPFQNHPFVIREDDSMRMLTESV